MATFDEFYGSLDPDVGIRGKQFEKFVKWFLKTDPTWASQVDEVWLWSDYPKRWGTDCGIDLIFTQKNGKTWAVQSKCVSPNNDIKKSEIDSFLSESNDSKIDGRLLIASTDGIGKNAQQVIHRQEKQVVCFLLEQLRRSEIEFPSSMKDLTQGKRKVKKTPRPHQIEAIEKVSEGLKTTDRGQVLMACGTGKTLTSLWIKEKIKAEQVLVLVPSLSLLSQTLKEWNAEANEPFKWICVCSDKSVAKDKSEDQWISNTSEIGVPVTSETLEVKHFLDESGSKVVFATYQSAQLIVEAQEHHDTSDFDLVIADEAHRCAGKVSDAFGSVLDENKIKASKRLFFTATPRILSKQIKTKSLDMDFEIASMDDHSVFGEVLYELKFSEAIKRDILSDYQVVIIGVDDEMIKQKIVNRELIKVDDEEISDAETIASQIAITKAIKDYDMNRIITFHSKIKNAKDFSKTFDHVIKHIEDSDLPSESINCEHISGVMKTSERNQKLYELKNLKNNERRILTNARCLSEGVDVPTLSGIAFINPKQSQIDIIQAVGRAIRKSVKKIKGIIVIPLYISEQESIEEAILLSNFQKVWQIVIALKSQDDFLMDEIDQLRISLGKKEAINFEKGIFEKVIFDFPDKLPSNFIQSIKTKLIEQTSDNWLENYGKLKKFMIENNFITPKESDPFLGSFVHSQRVRFKRNLLKDDRIKLLKDIKFMFDPTKEIWDEQFHKLKKFYDSNAYSSLEHFRSDDYKFYNWINWQRQEFKKNKLDKYKINRLKSINFIFDIKESKWMEMFEKLKDFYYKNGHSTPEVRKDELGRWTGKQRSKYLKGNRGGLDQSKINLLESIEFEWDPHNESWLNNFKLLKEFFNKNGNGELPQGHILKSWVRTQRKLQPTNSIYKERIDLLNSIKFNWESDFQKNAKENWDKMFNQLQKFYVNNGHIDIKIHSSDLGRWINQQRNKYNQNKLSIEKIKSLESIEGWKWSIFKKKTLKK